MKRQKTNHDYSQPSNHCHIDYKTILQEHPQLQSCRRFVPSEELIIMLDGCVLKGSCPSLNEIARLKRAGLGKLITLTG